MRWILLIICLWPLMAQADVLDNIEKEISEKRKKNNTPPPVSAHHPVDSHSSDGADNIIGDLIGDIVGDVLWGVVDAFVNPGKHSAVPGRYQDTPYLYSDDRAVLGVGARPEMWLDIRYQDVEQDGTSLRGAQLHYHQDKLYLNGSFDRIQTSRRHANIGHFTGGLMLDLPYLNIGAGLGAYWLDLGDTEHGGLFHLPLVIKPYERIRLRGEYLRANLDEVDIDVTEISGDLVLELYKGLTLSAGYQDLEIGSNTLRGPRFGLGWQW